MAAVMGHDPAAPGGDRTVIVFDGRPLTEDAVVIYAGIQELVRHAKRLDALRPTTEAGKRKVQAAATLLRQAAEEDTAMLEQMAATGGESDE